MKINIVNVKECLEEDWTWDFYLGRKNKTYDLQSSPLASTFIVKKESERDSVLEEYREWLFEELIDPMSDAFLLLDEIIELLLDNHQVALACFCSPKRCHCEIVADYIVSYLGKKTLSEGSQTNEIEVVYQSNKKRPGNRTKIKQNPLQRCWSETYNPTACIMCQRCELSESRIHSVWIRGEGKSKLMIVGEAPGQEEDRVALPFVGDSGKMLELMLQSVGLSSQEDCWIVNACKCRPPDNRTPTASEVDSCFPYLQQQIVELQPKVILALGGTSTKRLIGKSDFKITNCRGKIYPLDLSRWNLPSVEVDESDYIVDYIVHKSALEKTLVVPTYHPAYLLRNPQKEVASPKWQAWQDMQLVAKLLRQTDEETVNA